MEGAERGRTCPSPPPPPRLTPPAPAPPRAGRLLHPVAVAGRARHPHHRRPAAALAAHGAADGRGGGHHGEGAPAARPARRDATKPNGMLFWCFFRGRRCGPAFLAATHGGRGCLLQRTCTLSAPFSVPACRRSPADPPPPDAWSPASFSPSAGSCRLLVLACTPADQQPCTAGQPALALFPAPVQPTIAGTRPFLHAVAPICMPALTSGRRARSPSPSARGMPAVPAPAPCHSSCAAL